MNTVGKIFFIVCWAPGFVVGFLGRLVWQGLVIGADTCDDLLDRIDD